VKYLITSRGAKVIVDPDTYERFAHRPVFAYASGYVICREGKKTKYLHRLIMNEPVGQSVDHINGDKLDNRRSNLRICSHFGNMRNRKTSTHAGKQSRFKGVYWSASSKKWAATIGVYSFEKRRSVPTYLGVYLTEEAAALAYNKAASKLFGEFARLNEVCQ
jgi:hypothetical protein